MSEHLTEEEQLETIKRWWSDNWFSIALPIALAALVYTGWNFWTNHQTQQVQLSSDKYQALVTLMAESPEGELSDDMRGQVRSLAEEILSVSKKGAYADFTRLILAKVEYGAENMDASESALRSVRSGGANESVKSIATARLAKLLIDKGELDEALDLVGKAASKESKALYAEVRGDAYVAKGETAAANTAYKEALESLEPQQRAQSAVLQLKLQSTEGPKLASVADSVEEVDTISEAQTSVDTEESDGSQ